MPPIPGSRILTASPALVHNHAVVRPKEAQATSVPELCKRIAASSFRFNFCSARLPAHSNIIRKIQRHQ